MSAINMEEDVLLVTDIEIDGSISALLGDWYLYGLLIDLRNSMH